MRVSGRCIHALVIAGLFVLGNAPVAADDIICPPDPGSIKVDGNVLVTGDCRLDGTEVEGNVVLFSGGSVTLREARIKGNVQSSVDSAFEVDIGASRIGGSIQLDGLVGDDITIRNSGIDGNIQVDHNRARLQIDGNAVEGDVLASRNTGGIDIVWNRIGGNLECRANAPAPTGNDNTVEGDRERQCASLEPKPEPEPEPEPAPEEPAQPDSGNTGDDPGADEPPADPSNDNTAEENNLKGSTDLALLSLLGLLLSTAVLRRRPGRS